MLITDLSLAYLIFIMALIAYVYEFGVMKTISLHLLRYLDKSYYGYEVLDKILCKSCMPVLVPVCLINLEIYSLDILFFEI